MRHNRVPLVGRIAAGQPLLWPDAHVWQSPSEFVEIPPDMASNLKDVYAVQVQGDSMRDGGVNDGDIVIVRHKDTAVNGDRIVAWIKDRGLTLKHYYYLPELNLVRLQPANSGYEPQIVPPEDLVIQGKVIGVLPRPGVRVVI